MTARLRGGPAAPPIFAPTQNQPRPRAPAPPARHAAIHAAQHALSSNSLHKRIHNTREIAADQMDLGLDTILALFSKQGLEGLFSEVQTQSLRTASSNARRIYALQETYLDTIDPVIQFLQDQDPTLAHLICEQSFLPEASKFAQLEDLEWAFGSMGIRDRARYLATLYLEDISDFIVEMIDAGMYDFTLFRHGGKMAELRNIGLIEV